MKYPRTYHFSFSHCSNDDKMLDDNSYFLNKEIICSPDFPISIAKYVKKSFTESIGDEHWKHKQIVRNKLKK